MRHARWPFHQTDRTSLPEALSQTLRDSALTAPSNCGACSMEPYCEPLTEITMASIPSLSRRTGGSSPTGRAQEATTAWSASGVFRMECSSDTSTKIQIMFYSFINNVAYSPNGSLFAYARGDFRVVVARNPLSATPSLACINQLRSLIAQRLGLMR